MTFNYPWRPRVYRLSSPWPNFCWSSSFWFFEEFLYLPASSFSLFVLQDLSVELDFKWLIVGSLIYTHEESDQAPPELELSNSKHTLITSVRFVQMNPGEKGKPKKSAERKYAFSCHWLCYIWVVNYGKVLWFLSVNLGNFIPKRGLDFGFNIWW